MRQVCERSILNSYAGIERRDAERNIQRLDNGFAQIGKELHIKVADWGLWDDTYRYMSDHNAQYIKSNMELTSLAAIKVDFVMLIATNHRPIYSFAVNPVIQKDTSVQAELMARLALALADPKRGKNAEGFCGLIKMTVGPMVTSVHPIFKRQAKDRRAAG